MVKISLNVLVPIYYKLLLLLYTGCCFLIARCIYTIVVYKLVNCV